jgi:hypothetical protein
MYAEGRTETIRTTSIEAEAFVEAFEVGLDPVGVPGYQRRAPGGRVLTYARFDGYSLGCRAVPLV